MTHQEPSSEPESSANKGASGGRVPRLVRLECCEAWCRKPVQWVLEYVDMPARSIYHIYACDTHRTIKGPWKSLSNAIAMASADTQTPKTDEKS